MPSRSPIARNVVAELAREPGVDAARVAVSAERGRVRLTGTVGSAVERAFAELAARRALGVRCVTNEITVDRAVRSRPDAAQRFAEARLRCRVRAWMGRVETARAARGSSEAGPARDDLLIQL